MVGRHRLTCRVWTLKVIYSIFDRLGAVRMLAPAVAGGLLRNCKCCYLILRPLFRKALFLALRPPITGLQVMGRAVISTAGWGGQAKLSRGKDGENGSLETHVEVLAVIIFCLVSVLGAEVARTLVLVGGWHLIYSTASAWVCVCVCEAYLEKDKKTREQRKKGKKRCRKSVIPK